MNNGTGTGATATATIDASGRISSINIDNAGAGYTSAPNVNLILTPENLTAKGVATITQDGFITGVTITNAGGGYVDVPNMTITASVNGKGAGAAGVALIQNGVVTGVDMSTQGSGYTGQNYFTAFGAGADVAGEAFNLFSPSVTAESSTSGAVSTAGSGV